MTVQVHIENIFPTPIYLSEIDVSGINFDRIPMRKNGSYVTLSETGSLLDDYQYKQIKNQIDEHMRHYYHGVLQYGNEMYPVMTSSWLVKSLPNQESTWHIHVNSFFTGVLYLKTDSNSGNISFKQESDMLAPLMPPIQNLNNYNNRIFIIEPKNGLLVLFPSKLHHKVGKNLSNSIRTSIAFNYFLKGKITDPRTAALEIL